MHDLVIITGASSGLGLALARTVPFPATVVDISRSGPTDEGIDHIGADLSDPTSWKRVGAAMARLLRENEPDRGVFIHAAGTLAPIGFAGEVETDAYLSNVILNSASGQVLGHAFLEAVGGRSGTFDIVMISSGAAGRVYPGWSSYGAGKAALNQWVVTVGAEQRERGGARVAAISPGVVATAMQREIREADEHDFPDVGRFERLHAEGRLATPEEAARGVWRAIERGLDSGSVIDLRDV